MKKYIKIIYYFAKKYKLLFLIAEICILITYSVSLILPLNLENLVDKVIYAGKYGLLYEVIKNYIILFLISTITNAIYSYVWQKLYNKFVVDVKCTVYEKIIKAKADILSNINSGDIMSRIDWDSDQFIYTVQRNLFHFINSIILCFGILIIILKINISIALLAVAAAALPIIYTRACGKYNEKYSRENRDVNGKFTGRIFEIFKGFREIKINNSENWVSNQIITYLNKLIKLGNKLRQIAFFVDKGIYLLNLITSIVIYFISVNLILNNKLTIGEFLAIISYIALLHKKFNWILKIYLDWKGRKVSIDRVSQVLEYENEEKAGSFVTEIESIAFKNVVFSYGEKEVLKTVDFCINSGDKVAIVGISGIGKSTIVNLILKLYEIKSGDIFINDKSFNEINGIDIRNKCSVVSQDIMLFDDTIKANLLVGRERSDEEINNALQKVGLLEKINELPTGLDTKITSSFDLSGGQKQRLMIARAILKGTKTYIFDEATSALDVITEKSIVSNILLSEVEKTVIVISHRYATVAACEKVIVINAGQIEYAGSVAEAQNKSKKFKEMFEEV